MLLISRVKKIIFALVLIVGIGSVVHFGYSQNRTKNEVNKISKKHENITVKKDNSSGLIYIAAAICVGFSSIAAGWAVSTVGAAAMGAISEKPELAGRALIFVGLAEGIAIYGLIIAIMLLGKV